MKYNNFKGSTEKWYHQKCSEGIEIVSGNRAVARLPIGLHESKEIKEEVAANAVAIIHAPQLYETVYKIMDMSMDDSGREGCTYGDTAFDSQSVVYGYNLAIDHIQDILQKIMK